MGKISIFSSGPQMGNRFSVKAAVQSGKDVTDQMSLNATIERTQKVRARYDAVPQEGKQIASGINEKGDAMASTGAERAGQIRDMLDQSISGVQQNTSKDVAGKTALVQAVSQASAVETSKGSQISFDA